MCKAHSKQHMDLCMKKLIPTLNRLFDNSFKTVGCCCGHGKYPMTIIVETPDGRMLEICHDIYLPRKARFYRKDEEGYFYIPEVMMLYIGAYRSRRL